MAESKGLKVLVAVASKHGSTLEIADVIAEELGQPPKMNGMGKTMMRIGGLFIPGTRDSRIDV